MNDKVKRVHIEGFSIKQNGPTPIHRSCMIGRTEIQEEGW